MAQKYLSVKNFERYQRYTDRLPPWIKLHYALLEDSAWMLLDEVSQCRYFKLLLVASRCDNRILDDQIYLRHMLRISGEVDLTPLIISGFVVAYRAKKRRDIQIVSSHSVHREAETEKNKIKIKNKSENKNKNKSSGEVRTSPRAPAKSAEVWGAYAGAYRRRYGIDPVRNKKTNVHLCQLVDRLGADEAPPVAAFYLALDQPFYVSRRHPVNLLVQDAEGLRTQWVTGRSGEPVRPRTVAEML